MIASTALMNLGTIEQSRLLVASRDLVSNQCVYARTRDAATGFFLVFFFCFVFHEWSRRFKRTCNYIRADLRGQMTRENNRSRVGARELGRLMLRTAEAKP
jgi:hypothetical protein